MSVPADFAQLAEDLAPEDVRRVLGVFETDVRRLVGNLGAAANAGDVNAFKRVAHGLAGAAGAVGTRQLEQACRAAMGGGELSPASLVAIGRHIDTLAESALGDLAEFVAGLEVSARRG